MCLLRVSFSGPCHLHHTVSVGHGQVSHQTVPEKHLRDHLQGSAPTRHKINSRDLAVFKRMAPNLSMVNMWFMLLGCHVYYLCFGYIMMCLCESRAECMPCCNLTPFLFLTFPPQQVTQIDNDLKARASAYNNLKGNLQNLERKNAWAFLLFAFCVCVCVCVWIQVCVCVCEYKFVCVCVKERVGEGKRRN